MSIITNNEKLIEIYQTVKGVIEFRLDTTKETILLTQQQVGELFNVQKSAISKHAKNIFETGELDKISTVSKMETVQTEGNRKITRKIEYYNLDLILSIGYRVNSANATKFRQWASKILKQYLITGYAINKNRLLEVTDKLHDLKATILFLQQQSRNRHLNYDFYDYLKTMIYD